MMLTRAAFVFLAVVAAAGPQAQDERPGPPVPADLTEDVEVRILQMEVTAWPKDGDETRRDLPVAWLDPEGKAEQVAARELAGCGWLVGEVESPLEPGLWDFYAPSFGSGGAPGRPALTFRINATSSAGAAP